MACSTFVGFIAEDLQQDLCQALQKRKFFSLQMDGSTDAANNEEEIFFYQLTWMSVTVVELFM